jgi:hypothetical protein
MFNGQSLFIATVAQTPTLCEILPSQMLLVYLSTDSVLQTSPFYSSFPFLY